MKNKLNLKKILIPAAVVLVLAIGLGIWYFVGHNSSEPVNVYPFHYLGMTEYWGDSQESYGPVTTDKIQTVYLTDTQTVTEILVAPGDTVKKGDLLMTFDTTLSDLALERERLNVEKLKLQLQDAKDQLAQINSMKPMVIPVAPDPPEVDENLGTALRGAYQISSQSAYDGSTKEKALICWIGGSTAIDDSLFEAIRQVAEEYQEKNAKAEAAKSVSAQGGGYEVIFLSEVTETPTDAPTDPPVTDPPATDPPATDPPATDPPATDPPATDPPATDPPATDPPATDPPATDPPAVDPTDPPADDPTEPDIDLTVNCFYCIFKVTMSDMSLGYTTTWQGMIVTRDASSGRYSFKLFDASGISDHMKVETGADAPDMPEIDYGSGFTAAQIAQMRAEQEKTIKDLQFQVKMAEADYKIKQTEISDGNIYAQIDGEVVSVLSEDEAKMTQQPVLKVSGGGGFYVEGFVSELEKDNLQIGQEVTINDWNTGMTYTGTIDSLGDFPSPEGYWNGMGNPNASYYPFTVFVDGSADLQEGRYVSVMYSSAAAESGIYLQNPFLRTENGRTYIYVLGENSKLKKRFVTTGKSLWGSYTEVLEGLTAEDYIAFPYGKTVKDGAPAVECEDMSKLYG